VSCRVIRALISVIAATPGGETGGEAGVARTCGAIHLQQPPV